MLYEQNQEFYPWYDDRHVTVRPPRPNNYSISNIVSSPRRIYEFLDSKIAGNDELKRTVACAVYSHFILGVTGLHGLVIGNSGCGKSFIFKVLSELVPVVIADCSNMSPATYKGTCRLTSPLDQLCKKTESYTPKGIVVFDEYDKLLEKQANLSVESEVLVMMTGGDVYIGSENASADKPNMLCSTDGILFFFRGTFAGLKKYKQKGTLGFGTQQTFSADDEPYVTKDDLLEAKGNLFSNEFLGRISSITSVENMSEEKIRYILKDERYSPVTQLSKKYNIELYLTDDTSERLCVLGKDYGLRGITNEINSLIQKSLFETDAHIKELTL